MIRAPLVISLAGAVGALAAAPAIALKFAALPHVTLPAHGFAVLKPEVAPPGGYTNDERVQ
jgi:hypothetical protein